MNPTRKYKGIKGSKKSKNSSIKTKVDQSNLELANKNKLLRDQLLEMTVISSAYLTFIRSEEVKRIIEDVTKIERTIEEQIEKSHSLCDSITNLPSLPSLPSLSHVEITDNRLSRVDNG